MQNESVKNHHLELASEYVEKARQSISALHQAKQTNPEILHALQNLSNATEEMNTILKQWWPRMQS